MTEETATLVASLREALRGSASCLRLPGSGRVSIVCL